MPPSSSDLVPIKLDDQSTVLIQVTQSLGPLNFVLETCSLEEVTAPIASLASALYTALQATSPQKTAVQFGISIGVESGKLTPILVQGTTDANVIVKINWDAGESSK
jgi:hypothetical protein